MRKAPISYRMQFPVHPDIIVSFSGKSDGEIARGDSFDAVAAERGQDRYNVSLMTRRDILREKIAVFWSGVALSAESSLGVEDYLNARFVDIGAINKGTEGLN